MSKNDWNAGDTGTRSRMNQPYWLASGTVAGTGDAAGVVRVFVSPGNMRWPFRPSPLINPNLDKVTFGPAQADYSYMVFMRRDGTFMVSGSPSALAVFQTAITPPRYDAEPIGMVQTGATVTTANLTGPWNTASTSLLAHEQRGQHTAAVAGRPRAIYRNTTSEAASATYTTGRGTIEASVNSLLAASGIAFLSLDDFTAHLHDGGTLLFGAVRWLPSGALTTGALYVTPVFAVCRGEQVGGSVVVGAYADQRNYSVLQDPDSQTPAVRGSLAVHTTSFSALSHQITPSGYALTVHLDASANRTDANAAIRIAGVSFTAVPALRAANTVEEP